jgi:hypothetical protein
MRTVHIAGAWDPDLGQLCERCGAVLSTPADEAPFLPGTRVHHERGLQDEATMMVDERALPSNFSTEQQVDCSIDAPTAPPYP